MATRSQLPGAAPRRLPRLLGVQRAPCPVRGRCPGRPVSLSWAPEQPGEAGLWRGSPGRGPSRESRHTDGCRGVRHTCVGPLGPPPCPLPRGSWLQLGSLSLQRSSPCPTVSLELWHRILSPGLHPFAPPAAASRDGRTGRGEGCQVLLPRKSLEGPQPLTAMTAPIIQQAGPPPGQGVGVSCTCH